ncbi:uncharacterized protein E0L32_005377 [Thyridium curvatum]|uniref:PHD-type domain-containing protein n=1 Tax=Thyridium curvatum TaxID=1093900 RepID=A0A507B3I4_9PEZI|nr:uncharacterized protein E0L32_005377 [Thyridium curvatum]TPX14413.1 hypothetical protein E0L32_005377 [Thyridium curvatum]
MDPQQHHRGAPSYRGLPGSSLQRQLEDRRPGSAAPEQKQQNTGRLQASSMPPTCYNCKQGKRIDKPLFACSKCGKHFHSACHRPLPKDSRDWTCKKCHSKEPKSRYHEAGSTSSSLSTRNSTPTLQQPPAPAHTAHSMARNGPIPSTGSADSVDYVLPSLPCAYSGCKAMTSSGLQIICDYHIKLLDRAPGQTASPPIGEAQEPAPHHETNTRVLPILRRKTAPTASKAARSSATPIAQSPAQSSRVYSPQQTQQGINSNGPIVQTTPGSATTTQEHANKKVRLNGTEPDFRLNGHYSSQLDNKTTPGQPLQRLHNGVNGINGAHHQPFPVNFAGRPYQARSADPPSRPEPTRSFSGTNGYVPGAGAMANGYRSASVGHTVGQRPQGAAGSTSMNSAPGQTNQHAGEHRSGFWFASQWDKANPSGLPGWPLKANGTHQVSDRAEPPTRQAYVSAEKTKDGLVQIRGVSYSSATFSKPHAEPHRTQNGLQRPQSLEPKASASSTMPSVQPQSTSGEAQQARTPAGPLSEHPAAITGQTKVAPQADSQSRKGQDLDDIDLDSWIYNQEGASAPPPGLSLVPKKEMPAPHADPHYGHIDPRTHWSRERSQAWHAAKQKEIKERGGRKANCGKAAERLAKQRKTSGEKEEDTAREEVRENELWLRALQWVEKCDKQDWEKDKEASRQREIQEQLEADAAGRSGAATAARNKRR